ncbi:hypothetical protein CONPUDRAFT_73863 [Coniophora puteana RWD-64-598 SS2]|uniref:Uncharacterized protein n=1 Tax=Coniophora puteana (strain RWD-64-598) TaxID=741705 RepID=A0A5M3MQ48_CONPW|nr:uncharacterized protein CONPUDRAFT_73863 [Coniophora puteana RWD-64-598 SS2]EIW80844.1 hypothetical protein CONPUDRAFT_73863 [Coniophora puteana RWD-64-598 SS2]
MSSPIPPIHQYSSSIEDPSLDHTMSTPDDLFNAYLQAHYQGPGTNHHGPGTNYLNPETALPTFNTFRTQHVNSMGHSQSRRKLVVNNTMQVQPQETAISHAHAPFASATAQQESFVDAVNTQFHLVATSPVVSVATLTSTSSSSPPQSVPAFLPYASAICAQYPKVNHWTWYNYLLKCKEARLTTRMRGSYGYLKLEDRTMLNDSTRKQHTDFVNDIVALFPFMGLCYGTWKINKVAISIYPNWRQTWITSNNKLRPKSRHTPAKNPRVKKQDPNDATVSLGMKRNVSEGADDGSNAGASFLKKPKAGVSKVLSPAREDDGDGDALNMTFVLSLPPPPPPRSPLCPPSSAVVALNDQEEAIDTLRLAATKPLPQTKKFVLPRPIPTNLAKEALKRVELAKLKDDPPANAGAQPLPEETGSSLLIEQDASPVPNIGEVAPSGVPSSEDAAAPCGVAPLDTQSPNPVPQVNTKAPAFPAPAEALFQLGNKKIGKSLCAYRWLADVSIPAENKTREAFNPYWMKELSVKQRDCYNHEAKHVKDDTKWNPTDAAFLNGPRY